MNKVTKIKENKTQGTLAKIVSALDTHCFGANLWG